jgi:hypothetical protein
MTIDARDGVGENRLQFTTRMSMDLAFVPVWASTRATLSKITVCSHGGVRRGPWLVHGPTQHNQATKIELRK